MPGGRDGGWWWADHLAEGTPSCQASRGLVVQMAWGSLWIWGGDSLEPPLVRGFLCLFSARPEPQTLENGLGKRASVALCPPCCPSLRTLAFHQL